MNRLPIVLVLVLAVSLCPPMRAAAAEAPPSTPVAEATTNLLGWATNGPATYTIYSIQFPTNPPAAQPPAAPLPGDAAPSAAKQTEPKPSDASANSNRTAIIPVFEHFLPDSLNHAVWTNFIAHTNGRTTALWSARSHPLGWPSNAPIAAVWSTKSLVWGMKGMTALSPCWQNEGNSGQVPITALTRRHGYTRGHGMGADRIDKDLA